MRNFEAILNLSVLGVYEDCCLKLRMRYESSLNNFLGTLTSLNKLAYLLMISMLSMLIRTTYLTL